MNDEQKLEALHAAVYKIYQDASITHPRVTLDYTRGELGRLWAEIDYYEQKGK